MAENEITIKKLLEITNYMTHINIKRSDTGAIVISNVSALANSKDKRQMAKWEVFKDVNVNNIMPTIDIASYKRARGYINLAIEAWIYVGDYKKAIEKLSETNGI